MSYLYSVNYEVLPNFDHCDLHSLHILLFTIVIFCG